VNGVSRRLAVLCCLSILGVALVIGIVVGSLTGLPGTIAYAVVAGLVGGLAIARGRRLLRPPAPPPRPACTCCTGNHDDPIQVI
jgi:hypothetical protein